MTPFLIVVLSLACAAFVLLPLRSGASATIEYSNQDGKYLKEKQARLRRQLGDLAFDRSMEKVSADDYESARADLNAQLEELERGLEKDSTAAAPTLSSDNFDIETEILIARARRKRSLQQAVGSANWTCSCGRTMSGSDKFCASCGAARI